MEQDVDMAMTLWRWSEDTVKGRLQAYSHVTPLISINKVP